MIATAGLSLVEQWQAELLDQLRIENPAASDEELEAMAAAIWAAEAEREEMNRGLTWEDVMPYDRL